MLKNKSDSSIDLSKKTLIDDCFDERFSSSSSSVRNSCSLSSAICQAKLFDVPIPVQAILIDDGADNLFINYSISLDRLAIVSFYEREMERLGWQQLAESVGCEELLLVFDKPNKVCVISMRTSRDFRGGLLVVITTGFKKMGHSSE